MARLSMRCSDELVASVDRARGDVPRERWLRRAVERALEEWVRTSALGPPAPAEQLPGQTTVDEQIAGVKQWDSDEAHHEEYRRFARRGSPRRDVKPFPKGS